MAAIDWENTEKVLNIFGQKVVDSSRKNLALKGPLSDSIGYKYNQFPNSYSFDIKMLEYGNYQDKGVKGTKKGNWKTTRPKKQGGHGSPFQYKTGPGTKTIFQQIVSQPSFRTRDLKTGQFIPKTESSMKSAAFLIARSIGRFGLPAKRFMSKAIDSHGRTLTKNLGEAWVLDQQPYINNIKKAFKNPI